MGARFELGSCRATPGAMEALSKEPGREHMGGDWQRSAIAFLARHQEGDWGEVDDHDRAVNETALKTGARLLSAYTVAGEQIWIITEASRTETTILLPSEY